MKPGRDLDALVAEKVMGLGYQRDHAEQYGQYYVDVVSQIPVKHYSTDIAAAWEVVGCVQEKSVYSVLSLAGPSDESSKWFAIFERKWHGRSFTEGVYEWNEGETAPHAICLAALAALGYEAA